MKEREKKERKITICGFIVLYFKNTKTNSFSIDFSMPEGH